METLTPAALLRLSTEDLLVDYHRTHDPKLRAHIAERHEGLVHSLARKFARAGVPAADLMQPAWYAFLGALDRFDPRYHTKFSTYAVHCMVGEIKRYFRDSTWVMKVPRRLQELSTALPHAQDRLCKRLQREPTIDEMATELNATEDEVLQAMELGHAYQPFGLDERRANDDGQDAMPLGETVGGPDGALEGLVEHAPLRSALATLDERKRTILERRFFDGRSQQEVADELGFSQMHISRLERAALREMRAAMAPADVGS
jgi:RNA polymerase sigma-B factor